MLENDQLKLGALLNYVMIILNISVTLLYTPFMLGLLGQSEFGLYSLVSSIVAYLTILDLGLGNAIVRYTSKLIHEGKTKEQYDFFGMFLLLYTAIGVIVILLGIALFFNIESIFGSSMTDKEVYNSKAMILIMIVNLAFTFPMSIFGSIMVAYERFIFPRIINITRILLNTLTITILLLLGYKAIAIVISQTIFNILTLVVNYIYCKRKLKIKIRHSRFKVDLIKEIFIYSFWIFISSISDKIYWSTGQFVLGAISGTIAISIFALAIQFQSMYIQFSVAISSVFLPRVTGIITKGDDKKHISDLFIRTGRIQNIIIITILLGFVLFGKSFIKLWAGNQYEDSYTIVILFFVALYTPLIQHIGLIILQARNQMKFLSLSYILLAIVALILEVIGTNIGGHIGCATAISLSLIIGQGLIMNIYYKKKQNIDIKKFWREITKMNFMPLVTAIIFYILLQQESKIDSWLSLTLHISIFMIIYTPILYIFSLNKEEKELIKSFIYNKKLVN